MNNIKTKYDLLNEVYQDIELPKMAKTIMQYLVYKSNDKECFPSNDTIAAAVNCCKRYVQMNMRKLEKSGYIIRKARYYDHCQLTNKYCFNINMDRNMENHHICNEEKQICNTFFSNPKPIKCKKIDLLKMIYSSNLHKSDKAVIVYIINKSNNGCAYNSIDRLCKELHITSNMLKMSVENLRSKGLIKVKVHNGLIGIKLCIKRIKNVNRNMTSVDKVNAAEVTTESGTEVTTEVTTVLEPAIKNLNQEYQGDNITEKDYYQHRRYNRVDKILYRVKSVFRPIKKLISRIIMLL